MEKNIGIIALVCGVLGYYGGVLLAIFPYFVANVLRILPFFAFIASGTLLSGAAIAFGIMGLINDDSKSVSIAGLILGLSGIIFNILFLPFLIKLIALVLWD